MVVTAANTGDQYTQGLENSLLVVGLSDRELGRSAHMEAVVHRSKCKVGKEGNGRGVVSYDHKGVAGSKALGRRVVEPFALVHKVLLS